jgi:hypothetical protein
MLEGLALFAEFDATSGDCPVATWSSQVAGRLFCHDACKTALLAGKDILSPLKDKVETMRFSETVVRRKKALLSQDLSSPGGYLLGYLLVKSLWLDLTQRNSIWRNTDMFVMFYIDYIFNDRLLAHLLVGPPDLSIDDEIANLDAYLHNRVIGLGRQSASYGRQFVMYHTMANSPRPEYQNYSDSIEHTLSWEWGMRTGRSLHWHTPNITSTRCIPRVLAAPATVSIDESGKFTATFHDGSPPICGPALEAGMPAGGGAVTADGSVEGVVLLPQHGRSDMRVLLCVFLDKDLIATFDPTTGQFNDAEDAEACDKLASYLAIESFTEQVEQERRWLPDGSAAAKVLDRLNQGGATQRMIDLWAPIALVPDVGEPDRPSGTALLQKGGIKAALSLDDRTLGEIARMSLCPVPVETLSGRPASQLTNQALLDRVNAKCLEILGFRLLQTRDGSLEPSRV